MHGASGFFDPQHEKEQTEMSQTMPNSPADPRFTDPDDLDTLDADLGELQEASSYAQSAAEHLLSVIPPTDSRLYPLAQRVNDAQNALAAAIKAFEQAVEAAVSAD
jgi:hypothetical protein